MIMAMLEKSWRSWRFPRLMNVHMDVDGLRDGSNRPIKILSCTSKVGGRLS